jgi:peptide/nickel transport system substrate-binding protein
MQDDDYPGSPSLRRFWQSVTIRPEGEYQIAFDLQEPYGGFLELTTRAIVPVHLFDDISAADLPDVPFNREPVGTGPFMVETGQNWQQDRQLTLIPNPSAWREGAQTVELVFRFYPDEPSLLQAFEQGQIQAINTVSPAMLPAVAQLPQARLFTAEAPRYTTLLFNLTSSGSPATQSKEVRRSLAYGLDREALVDETLNGQGVLQTGPYLAASWAYNPAMLTLYSSQPLSATTGLDAAGWTLTEGEDMRRNGDSPMVLRFLVYDSPTNRALAEKIAEEWTELGVAPQLNLFSEWQSYRQALRDREFDVALVEVTPPADPDLYDFWSQEAIIDGQNYAGWNRRRASEALEDGRRLWEIGERRPYYDSFLRYYDEDLPELTLFHHVYTYAVNAGIEGVEIGLIDHPRDRYRTIADWILQYRDVTVSCEDDQG